MIQMKYNVGVDEAGRGTLVGGVFISTQLLYGIMR